MGRRGKRGTIFAALACAGVLAPAALALAADPIFSANTLNYSSAAVDTPAATFDMDRGERPLFSNTDTPDNPHNVTARGRIGGKPLFITPNVVGPTGSALVNGTQYLNTGSYPFFCSVHPEMEATLNVSAAGTPVARPVIAVKVLSGKIKRVANTRRARVRVRAVTDSNNVSLVLKLRNLRLGGKAGINLKAGQKRVLTLRLSKRAKKKLSARKRARVNLIGSVRFGARATASKLLK